MIKRLLDTNLVVRYLAQDHLQHAEVAKRLFERCDRGELTLVILPVVLAECVFVLESFYERPRHEIARVLMAMITAPNIELIGTDFYVQALSRYADGALHFVDCVIATHAAALDLPVATFDAVFTKLIDVRVKTD